MPLALSSIDIKRLDRAITTLLSPLEFETAEAWGVSAMTDVMSVLGADKAYFALPYGTGLRTARFGERTDDGLTTYLSYYCQVDHSLNRRRRERSLEVYHRDMLYDPGELARDELHNDWCVPHGLHDTLGMGIQVDSESTLPALLHVYHHRASAKAFGDRGLQLIRILLPSFKAGVAAWRSLFERRVGFTASLDTLGVPLALFNADGAFLHRTPTLGELLRAEPDGALMAGAMLMAHRLTARARGSRRKAEARWETADAVTVVTPAARYVLRGCIAERTTAGSAMVIVAIERAPMRRATVEENAVRFGLSSREGIVAARLARGDGVTAIATALRISRHTARHHIENIMKKLGAHTRAEAVARLTFQSVEDQL